MAKNIRISKGYKISGTGTITIGATIRDLVGWDKGDIVNLEIDIEAGEVRVIKDEELTRQEKLKR